MPGNAFFDELESYDMLDFEFLEMMEAETLTEPAVPLVDRDPLTG